MPHTLRQKRTAFASHRGNMASCSGRGRLGSIVAVIACLQLASLSGVCEAAHAQHTSTRPTLVGAPDSMPDTLLKNISEVLWSPAPTKVYLGSPSIVRTSTGALLVRSVRRCGARTDKD